jgi:glycine/D-amino acid oxidase-like deaminating enzyme
MNISANVVVNYAGMWARQFGEKCGVTIPNQAAEHYYLITEEIPGLNPRWPVVENPSKCIYIRPEGKGLLVGTFDRKERGCWWDSLNGKGRLGSHPRFHPTFDMVNWNPIGTAWHPTSSRPWNDWYPKCKLWESRPFLWTRIIYNNALLL